MPQSSYLALLLIGLLGGTHCAVSYTHLIAVVLAIGLKTFRKTLD